MGEILGTMKNCYDVGRLNINSECVSRFVYKVTTIIFNEGNWKSMK